MKSRKFSSLFKNQVSSIDQNWLRKYYAYGKPFFRGFKTSILSDFYNAMDNSVQAFLNFTLVLETHFPQMGELKLGTIHKWRHPRGGGRGVQKMAIWSDFQGLTGVTRGRSGSKNLIAGMTLFMDGPKVN